MPAWFAGGLLAIALADLDAGRGAGSAGLGWLLGFGCLGMAAHVHLRRVPARAAQDSFRDQWDLVNRMSDLPGPGATPFGAPEQADDLLGVTGGSLYEAKREPRRRRR
jgi:hypothetical protein